MSKELDLLQKVIKFVDSEYCYEGCDTCSRDGGCPIQEAKNYIEEEYGEEYYEEQ